MRLLEAKNHPCQDCGQSFPHYVMEFDHVPERGPKQFNISRGNTGSSAWLTELAKCDLVCANCHRARTYERTRAASPAPPPGMGP